MNKLAPVQGGTTFGLPWKKGKLDRNAPLYLTDGTGTQIPMQTTPRAYWPDGSVKWTLHSANTDVPANSYTISDKEPKKVISPKHKISVTETDTNIAVNTGTIICIIEKENETLISSITRPNGKPVCTGGRLVAINEQRHGKPDSYATMTTTEPFWGKGYYLFIEESGPERAVIRIRGSHVGQPSGMRTTSQFRKWLTFDLRLYFYAGSDEIRMVHTFIFDGREEEDFIKGIGMEFDIPLTSSLFNRYVRFGGETGMFADSPKSLWVRQKREYDKFYADQLDGKEVLYDAQLLLNDMTEWDDYKQTQLSAEEYVISKRTGEGCVMVRCANGSRALGVAFAGDSKRGLSLFQRDFWQKHPSSFEITGMRGDTATLKTWLWSPDAAPMDMRRYDNKTHVDACYEGFEEMRSSAYGIANTNEVVLRCYDAFPGNEFLVQKAQEWQAPNLLLAPVQHYIDSNVFGKTFSPVDTSTPGRAKVEAALESQLDFYKNEREQSSWYGFWDYGDIRHAYDNVRHSWRYDMGGYAWQNTELVPNLWLWFGFLRTQREDYFRWAEAMTRHTSEVDLYHLGDYKLLGSRHNVVHWGCGCKEARIGMCILHKVYYYLTGDERIGDIMDEEKEAHLAIGKLDPLRAYFTPNPEFPCHIRWGPDIIALLEIWLTRWERFEDTAYRDKIMQMLEHFRGPGGFAASTIWGYKPETGEMKLVERTAGKHFNCCFGTAYALSEVLTVLEDDALWQNFYDMGQIYATDFPNKAEKLEIWGLAPDGFKLASYFAGVSAIAAGARKDTHLAKEIWDILMNTSGHDNMKVPIEPYEVNSPRVHKIIQEASTVSGNSASQWGANTIVALAAIGDMM